MQLCKVAQPPCQGRNRLAKGYWLPAPATSHDVPPSPARKKWLVPLTLASRIAVWAKANRGRAVGIVIRGVLVHLWRVADDSRGEPFTGAVSFFGLGPKATERDVRELAARLDPATRDRAKRP